MAILTDVRRQLAVISIRTSLAISDAPPLPPVALCVSLENRPVPGPIEIKLLGVVLLLSCIISLRALRISPFSIL